MFRHGAKAPFFAILRRDRAVMLRRGTDSAFCGAIRPPKARSGRFCSVAGAFCSVTEPNASAAAHKSHFPRLYSVTEPKCSAAEPGRCITAHLGHRRPDSAAIAPLEADSVPQRSRSCRIRSIVLLLCDETGTQRPRAVRGFTPKHRPGPLCPSGPSCSCRQLLSLNFRGHQISRYEFRIERPEPLRYSIKQVLAL